MIKGYLVVSNQILSQPEYSDYIQFRQDLGYAKSPPDLHIRVKEELVQLKFAEPGLVETQAEAEALVEMLKGKYPKHDWKIVEKIHPEAEKVTWYKELPIEIKSQK